MPNTLPRLVRVKSLIDSRYGVSGGRPESWEQRRSGVDIIKTIDGEELKLQSDGQQSAPKDNWVILLTAGSSTTGFIWTLYGMP